MRERCYQMIAPVRASSAKTSSLPVVTYITPSLTSGVTSSEYLLPSPEPRCVTHAPFRFLTFAGVSFFSVEYRELLQSPPTCSHSAPAGLRRSGDAGAVAA